jgi:two-component system sensor histidine kinase RpfC
MFMMLRSMFLSPEMLRNQELQSALVRIAIWLFSILYVGLGAWTEYYDVNLPFFYTLFFGYLFYFLVILLSILCRPVLPVRPYITLLVDICAVSLAIFLTREAISPFYLLYIWIFVSYGTRYGKTELMFASIISVVAYNLVLIFLNQWASHTFEAFFFLLVLVVLPLYQYSLLRKLHLATQEAKHANKARGDFLAAMTHELRTPLIGILGMSRLMKGTPLDVEQKEYLHSIRSSAQLLRALIGDILDFSKIDSNKLELLDEPFDIRQLLHGVISALANEAQEKQLDLRCWIDPRLPHQLQGDNLRISQILFNLLGNAIKFTEQGSVMLRVAYAAPDQYLAQAYVLIEVEDTGIGIPQDKLERVFEKFWQLDVSNRRRSGGTGLGTTVARDLSRRMGGDILVRSQMGVGTTFSVRLPLIKEQGMALPVHSPLLKGKRILIFESNEQDMSLHLKIVDELGMQAIAVLSLNALTAYLDQHFDVVLICDSLAGVPLGQVLNQVETLQGSPTILLAGYRGRNIAVPAPVSRLLMKPFLADELAEAIIHPLRESESQRDFLSPVPNREARESSGIQILLAEDNAIAAKVLSTLLLQRGHSVHLVKDGQEALDAVAKTDYHLAFIDLRMPRMDGIEFTRCYRSKEAASRHLPIYALTANSAEDAKKKCLEGGMDGFLNKPVEPEQLDAIIERHVGVEYCPG